jgi:hypothetical protein
MSRSKLCVIVLILLVGALTACENQGGAPDVQRPDRPAITPPSLPSSGDRTIVPSTGERTPGALPINLTPNGERTPPASVPTLQPQGTPPISLPTAARTISPPPATVTNVTRIPQYDAAQMITSFATQYLGTSVTVVRAGGATGNVNVPSVQQAQVNAGVSVAGQSSVGVITLKDAPGVAQVAVGSGTISGDLSADISGASLGAYSVTSKSTSPTSASAALQLIRSTYPSLANINLAQKSATQTAYVFAATITHQGVDWQTKKAVVVNESIVAGTTRTGPSTFVWVIVGNGTYATSVKP